MSWITELRDKVQLKAKSLGVTDKLNSAGKSWKEFWDKPVTILYAHSPYEVVGNGGKPNEVTERRGDAVKQAVGAASVPAVIAGAATVGIPATVGGLVVGAAADVGGRYVGKEAVDFIGGDENALELAGDVLGTAAGLYGGVKGAKGGNYIDNYVTTLKNQTRQLRNNWLLINEINRFSKNGNLIKSVPTEEPYELVGIPLKDGGFKPGIKPVTQDRLPVETRVDDGSYIVATYNDGSTRYGVGGTTKDYPYRGFIETKDGKISYISLEEIQPSPDELIHIEGIHNVTPVKNGKFIPLDSKGRGLSALWWDRNKTWAPLHPESGLPNKVFKIKDTDVPTVRDFTYNTQYILTELPIPIEKVLALELNPLIPAYGKTIYMNTLKLSDPRFAPPVWQVFKSGGTLNYLNYIK